MKIKKLYAGILLSLGLTACSTQHTPDEIIKAMQRYDRLIEKMDADSIVNLYTENGELGTVATGRDSIRKFLATFTDVHVISNVSDSDTIHIYGDSAVQFGVYKQEVILATKDTAHLKGKFRTHWIYEKNNGWKIRKIETTPLKD
jgi:ketosteroid isomerase-like protein